MAYRLRTYGGLTLTNDTGNEIALPSKALLCIAYLYVRRGTVTRRDIATMLWPDVSHDVALTNLRSTLLRMQNRLEGPVLLVQGAGLRLTEEISGDLDCFTNDRQGLPNQMFDLLRQPFIPCLPREMPQTLRAWFDETRRVHLGVFRRLLLDQGSQQVASDHALLLLELDPTDEELRDLLVSSASSRLVPLERQRLPAFPAAPQAAPGLAAARGIPRLALLPPDGPDKSGPYEVARGLIEDVTIALCRNRSLAVVAPYSSEQIRRETDKAALLQQFGVTYVMDCRLSARGFFSQLVFYPQDEVVWAERFDLASLDAVEVRNRLAREILAAIASSAERNQARHSDFRAHPDAYRLFLLGLNEMNGLQLPAVRRSRKLFRQALSSFEGFAAANSAISRTLSLEWLLTAQGDKSLLETAALFARSAIEREPMSAAGYRELGVAQLYLGDVDGSLAYLQKAEQLSPHHADGLYSYADTLVHASRPEQALSKLKIALDLNPLAPDAYYWSAAGACYFLERYDEALDYVALMKDKTPADRIAAASHAMLGNKPQARHLRRRSMSNNPSFDIETWTSLIPFKEPWQNELYLEGLRKAGF